MAHDDRPQTEDRMPTIGRHIHELTTIIVDGEYVMRATGRPYWCGYEWYVDAKTDRAPDSDICSIALATITLPI